MSWTRPPRSTRWRRGSSRTQLSSRPLYAAQLGYGEHLGRLPDLSEDARQSRRARLDALGLRAADVDEGALDRERAITRQMALRYVPTH